MKPYIYIILIVLCNGVDADADLRKLVGVWEGLDGSKSLPQYERLEIKDSLNGCYFWAVSDGDKGRIGGCFEKEDITDLGGYVSINIQGPSEVYHEAKLLLTTEFDHDFSLKVWFVHKPKGEKHSGYKVIHGNLQKRRYNDLERVVQSTKNAVNKLLQPPT